MANLTMLLILNNWAKTLNALTCIQVVTMIKDYVSLTELVMLVGCLVGCICYLNRAQHQRSY